MTSLGPIDQAIFTSLPARQVAGYHLAAWSRGVSDEDRAALTSLSPSHGSLLTDAANRASLNGFRLPSGRVALSRTILGRAEYSGRGGNQVYTHTLVLDRSRLEQACGNVLAIVRQALAHGLMLYNDDPPQSLPQVDLPALYPPRAATPPVSVGPSDPPGLAAALSAIKENRSVSLTFSGSRIALLERVLSLLGDAASQLTFSTSLRPSAVRPCNLVLLPVPSRVD